MSDRPLCKQVQVGCGLFCAYLEHTVPERRSTCQTSEHLHYRSGVGINLGEPEADDGLVVGTTTQLIWCSLGDDPTVDHHRNPVSQYLDLVHVVACKEDGRTEGLETLDHLP